MFQGCLRNALFCLIAISPLVAQTGNVSGSVSESSQRTLLSNAAITVVGSGISTITDDSGQFILLGVPSGPAKITASYLGMEPVTLELAVKPNATTQLDFTLSLNQRSSVTVTSDPVLDGQAKALNDQKNAITLVNVVASDQIGSFPDPNAAEAIQRIPGIVVQRDQGEGRYVLIRGTEPRLSATTINGERIGTTENTSRQIPLDTIPADLLGSIEILKVLTPDVEADSIGGRVNLVTKRAPATRHIGLTAASGFNTLVRNDIKDYNGSFGQRFFNSKLGFIGSGNFYQNNRGSQDAEPAYTNGAVTSLDLRDYVLTRTRAGGVANFDYRLKPGSELFFRTLRTNYQDSELRHRLRNLISTNRLERLLRDRYHDSNQTALSAGGSHALPNSWLVSYRGAYSFAKLETPYRLEGTYRQTGVTFAPNASDPSHFLANPQNENLNAFTLISNAIQNDRGGERNVSGGFDVAAPKSFGPSRGGLLKFGLKVRDEDRTRDVNSFSQAPARGTTVPLTAITDPDYSPADNYLGGRYNFGTLFPDVLKQRALSRGGTLVNTFAATGDSGSYRAHERVTAGYVMDEIYLGERTTLLPGIRFESTSTTYGAPVYNTTAAGVIRNFSTGQNSYLNILPGLHLRQRFTDNTQLRVSFSRSLARANYSDLAPFVLQDTTGLTITRGNPALNTTTANNVDVSVEHYFQNVGLASAGFFYKNLNDYIFSTTFQQTIGNDLYRITQPVNGESANIYGMELTLVRQLDFLPGLARNFSVYANFTKVHSDAKLPRGNFILPGQASNMGNASLAWEKRGFSARVSFNYQGRYILAIGGTPADDTWLDNRLEIDFSASQRITKHIRFFIDAINLGNDPYRVYQGIETRPIQSESYKIWAITGFKFDF